MRFIAGAITFRSYSVSIGAVAIMLRSKQVTTDWQVQLRLSPPTSPSFWFGYGFFANFVLSG